jgi:hypothetical protein
MQNLKLRDAVDSWPPTSFAYNTAPDESSIFVDGSDVISGVSVRNGYLVMKIEHSERLCTTAVSINEAIEIDDKISNCLIGKIIQEAGDIILSRRR